MPGFRPGDAVELFGTQTETRNWVRDNYPQCLVLDEDGNETGELQSAYDEQWAIEYFPTLQDLTPNATDEILMIEARDGDPALPTGPGVRPKANLLTGWAGAKRRPDDPDPGGRVIDVPAVLRITEAARNKLLGR